MPDHDLTLLVRKLQANDPLPEEARDVILALPYTRKSVPPSTYLVREGEPPRTCSVLISGFAYRHKIVGDGGRQIVSMHIPGEAVDLQGLYLDYADHNVQTLTPAELAVVPMKAMRELVEQHPAVARAVMLDILVEASVFREWLANIGRRDARTRLAHLLCEFASRLDAQRIGGPTYELPMTQEQIGDALGLTSVHVNRSIKALDSEGLVSRARRTISFPDIAKLRHIADFSELYLHGGETGRQVLSA